MFPEYPNPAGLIPVLAEIWHELCFHCTMFSFCGAKYKSAAWPNSRCFDLSALNGLVSRHLKDTSSFWYHAGRCEPSCNLQTKSGIPLSVSPLKRTNWWIPKIRLFLWAWDFLLRETRLGPTNDLQIVSRNGGWAWDISKCDFWSYFTEYFGAVSNVCVKLITSSYCVDLHTALRALVCRGVISK